MGVNVGVVCWEAVAWEAEEWVMVAQEVVE